MIRILDLRLEGRACLAAADITQGMPSRLPDGLQGAVRPERCQQGHSTLALRPADVLDDLDQFAGVLHSPDS